MREYKLYIVHYRQQFQLVILVVINKGVKSLIKVLVYNLSLAINLKVEYSKKFNLNFKDMAKFILEV